MQGLPCLTCEGIRRVAEVSEHVEAQARAQAKKRNSFSTCYAGTC